MLRDEGEKTKKESAAGRLRRKSPLTAGTTRQSTTKFTITIGTPMKQTTNCVKNDNISAGRTHTGTELPKSRKKTDCNRSSGQKFSRSRKKKSKVSQYSRSLRKKMRNYIISVVNNIPDMITRMRLQCLPRTVSKSFFPRRQMSQFCEDTNLEYETGFFYFIFFLQFTFPSRFRFNVLNVIHTAAE